MLISAEDRKKFTKEARRGLGIAGFGNGMLIGVAFVYSGPVEGLVAAGLSFMAWGIAEAAVSMAVLREIFKF